MVKSTRKQAAKEKPTPMDVVKPSGVVKPSHKRPELTVVKAAAAHNKPLVLFDNMDKNVLFVVRIRFLGKVDGKRCAL